MPIELDCYFSKKITIITPVNSLKVSIIKINDTKNGWLEKDGWVKMARSVKIGPNAKGIEIHFYITRRQKNSTTLSLNKEGKR